MGRALDLPVFFGDAGSREVHPYTINSSFLPLTNLVDIWFYTTVADVHHGLRC